MPNKPTLYDLFDETSFRYWKLQLQNDNLPTGEQLARLLEANAPRPIPSWLTPLVIRGLRGELKGKPGRPKKGFIDKTRLELAAREYGRLLKQMPRSKQTPAKRVQREGPAGLRIPGTNAPPRSPSRVRNCG